MKTFFRIFIPLLILAALFLFFGILPRLHNGQELKAAADDETKRIALVTTTEVKATADTNGLTLPGQMLPYRETPLYARTQGFLQRRYVDLGATVRRGQLLALIEAPEFDQEIVRAQADLGLAQSNLDRVKSVSLPGAIAQQDIDSRQAALRVGQATLARLRALKSLQEVRAPFGGIITTRNAEEGNLVQAGAGQPLFVLAQLDTLRVQVDVPQTYFQAIKIGMSAAVTVPELRGQVFTGRVVRTSGTLRTSSRTLLAEVAIPNRARQLVAGLYGQVKLGVKTLNPPVLIPANTLLITPEGPRVAVISATNQLTVQSVTLGRDFGTTLEVIDGLRGGEHLVTNPSDRLQSGTTVRVKK